MAEIKLQLALDKQGNIVSIYKVKTGKECDCFCPVCKEPLIAKNRNKTGDKNLSQGQRIAHFSHFDGSNCATAPETALHLLAKKVLKERKRLLIPTVSHYDMVLSEEKLIEFDKVDTELKISTLDSFFVPDAIGYIRNKRLLIEFKVSHSVDCLKLEKIKEIGHSCVEIDLNNFRPIKDGNLNIDGLKSLLETDNRNKVWLYNSQAEKLYEEYIWRLDAKNIVKSDYPKNGQKTNEEIYPKLKDKPPPSLTKANKPTTIKVESAIDVLTRQGYTLEHIEEIVKYDESSFYDNVLGLRKIRNILSKEEFVSCPLSQESNENNLVNLTVCKVCRYYKNLLGQKVVCGFKNKIINIE